MSDPAAVVTALPEAALHDWIVAQRWFGSKAREVAQIEVGEFVALRTEAPMLVLAIVEARFAEGTHETYQLPLGLRRAAEGWSQGVIVEVEGWTVYDAFADGAQGRELLHRMRQGDQVPVEDGALRFRWAPSAPQGAAGSVEVRPVGVEQSNSSVVFGEALILKAFRRLEPGANPELELLRFLSARGFEHIAPLAGWYEIESRRIDATLGVLQEYLAGARDGWELTLDGIGTEPDALLERLRRLGGVTGELHSALGSEAEDPAFAPDEPSAEAMALLTADIDEQIEQVFLELPDEGATAVIAGRGQDVRERLQALSATGTGGHVIRTHGDLHLGQTMLTERFNRRSFSYAAAGSRILRGVEPPEGWEDRAREAYLEGYRERVDRALLPSGQDAIDRLLSVFELEKAVYELRYELGSRPDWVSIPVAGILRMLEAEL